MDFKHLNFVKSKFGMAADSQENKGLEKYGQPLDPMDDYDWLEMAEQELVDGYKYLAAEQVKRQKVIGEIRKIIENECEADVQVQVSRWLNVLEGKS